MMAKFLKVDVETRNFRNWTKNKQRQLEQLPEDALNFFVKNTPVRTGNARRKTYLIKNTITANYPYAGRLDEGYSRQSPSGMTEPTIDYIKRRFRQIMKGK